MLAGTAVLAIAVSLSVTTGRDHARAAAALPAVVGSYTALAAATGPGATARSTACGVVPDARLAGILSPVLPCGTRLYLTFHGRHVLAPVVGRGPSGPGAELGLTQALARRLGVTGVKRVRWSYAAQA